MKLTADTASEPRRVASRPHGIPLIRLVIVAPATLLLVGWLQQAATPRAPVAPNDAAGVERPRTSQASDLPQPPRTELPNILLITTDDQNASDLRWMPRTRKLLGEAGMTFSGALAPHPLCCPARASILTGQYAQNNGVRHNHGRYGGASDLDPSATIATWLKGQGYRTALVGKYLNEYGPWSRRAPGWSVWDPMVKGVYSYYGTRFFSDRDTASTRYSVDEVGNRTLRVLRRLASDERPFFIWSSQVAPHAVGVAENAWVPPAVPDRDAEAFAGVRAPSLGKPSLGAAGPPMPDLVGQIGSWSRSYLQHYFAERIRSLRSVDRVVARTIAALDRMSELSRTYVAFTSDNGYLLGEHRLVGKNVPYEEALRVPMLVRGPGVPARTRSQKPVTLVDLVPTFLDLTSTVATLRVDGASFAPLLHGHSLAWRDTQLILTGAECWDDTTPCWGFRGVRTRRFTYAVDPRGTELLFDRRKDPFQLTNLADAPAYRAVRTELARRTERLRGCAGQECLLDFGPAPRPRATTGR